MMHPSAPCLRLAAAYCRLIVMLQLRPARSVYCLNLSCSASDRVCLDFVLPFLAQRTCCCCGHLLPENLCGLRRGEGIFGEAPCWHLAHCARCFLLAKHACWVTHIGAVSRGSGLLRSGQWQASTARRAGRLLHPTWTCMLRSVRSAVIVHAAAGVFGGDVLRTTLGPRTAATTQIHTILLSWLLQRVLLAHASRVGRGVACMPSYVVCQLLLRKPHCADMCALCEATLQHFARMPL